MIAEKEITKLKEELTYEQLNKIVYYTMHDHFEELKELTRKKVKIKFVKKMRIYINKYLTKQDYNSDIKKESINLFKQAKNTLTNAHRFIKKNEIVDANSLLRSAFENIIMGTMISLDNNTFNEFVDLNVNEQTRHYTKPQTLRNNFRKVLKKIDGNIFDEISNKKLKNLLDEFYDGLCEFTHSTLIVNAMVEIDKDNDLDIYILFVKQNAYFVELLLYLCLKHLLNNKDQPIDLIYVFLGWYILLLDIPKEKINSDKSNKIYQLLYLDINKDYCEKSKNTFKSLKDEIELLKQEIENNSIVVIKILEEIVK